MAIHVLSPLAWIRDALIPMKAKVVTHFRLATSNESKLGRHKVRSTPNTSNILTSNTLQPMEEKLIAGCTLTCRQFEIKVKALHVLIADIRGIGNT